AVGARQPVPVADGRRRLSQRAAGAGEHRRAHGGGTGEEATTTDSDPWLVHGFSPLVLARRIALLRIRHGDGDGADARVAGEVTTLDRDRVDATGAGAEAFGTHIESQRTC